MIYIYPYKHFTEDLFLPETSALPVDYLWQAKERLFFFNAKSAIHYLINKYRLQRSDEVCIFTTSDKNYVSTCVSATFFNYCKLSRVLTPNTRMIYVIHEFGIPHPGIEQLVSIGRERGVPVVEDCAHTINSSHNGQRAGTFGDYAIYSLSKHLPVRNGGLLVGSGLTTHSAYYNPSIAIQVAEQYNKYFPYLSYITERRKIIFKKIRQQLPPASFVFDHDDTRSPYAITLLSEHYQLLYNILGAEIAECLPLYVENWFCLPLQPFIKEEQLEHLIEKLKHYV